MNGNVQEIAGTIKHIVATGGHIQGSRLSTLLKARVPGWSPADFGVQNLREFIATHVAGVIIAGRSGMDLVYALEGAASAPVAAAPTLPDQVDFWRVWVSPNSPYALTVDRTTGSLRAVPRGGAIEPGQILLEPPGVDVHRDVARTFLSTLPPGHQPKLQAVLESTNEQWWQAWLRELRGTEHLASWNAYRRQKLEERLSTQLQAAALEQPAVHGILKAVRESHTLVPQRARRAIGEGPQHQEDGSALRRIVAETVQRMSVSELRELRLPIGLVLDVLVTSKSR